MMSLQISKVATSGDKMTALEWLFETRRNYEDKKRADVGCGCGEIVKLWSKSPILELFLFSTNDANLDHSRNKGELCASFTFVTSVLQQQLQLKLIIIFVASSLEFYVCIQS